MLFSTVKVILTRKGNDSEKLKTCNSSESQTECEVIQSEHIADADVATAATVDPLDKANRNGRVTNENTESLST